jgi:DNA-binding NarL/FixJ family response regulator
MGTQTGALMKRPLKKQSSSPEAPTLTPRQFEVLQLITQGHTSREIGHLLKISLQTVEVHRYNLMQRLNVRNVAQLIRQAMVYRYVPNFCPSKDED